MSIKNKPRSSQSPDETPPTPTAAWTEHEHVTEPVQLVAQNLVHLAGSPELAKHAIHVAEQRQADSSSASGDSAQIPKMVNKQSDRLKQAIDGFETSLETPLVSGELIAWVTEARETLEQLGVLLHQDVQQTHADLYATILREDMELSSRVTELRATDDQLLRIEYGKVEHHLGRLVNQAQSVAQDESKAANMRAEVVKLSLAFVISLRTQETAITTWFSEAFNRDRGVGD